MSSSSDQLAPAWIYQASPFLADSWISEAFARDADVLTKALQKSLSDNLTPPDPHLNPYFNTQTPSSFSSGAASGSDFETLPPKRLTNPPPALSKITKRKSRASKRNTTTFITADPANFRQMVQQVTGVKFCSGIQQMPVSVPLLKPEPQRPSSYFNNRFQGCLPTLDTSALLLDYQQSMSTSSTPTIDQSPALADGGSGIQLGSNFSSFPTLESWN